jgi:hypothetical protein
MSRFQYRTTFDNVVSASSNFDKKMILSQASLESLRSIIPSNVDLNKNIDLVGAAFNAAVVNKFNKNGDGIDTDTAIAFKDYFIHKPTNIEHKRNKVVGHIVNAAFTSYGDNKILDVNQVVQQFNPFNIGLAAVVYKTVDRDFADALINSNDESSNMYQRISASWEIGFNDYLIAIGSDNLKDAEIISKKEQISEFKKYLKGFAGSGFMDDGTPIYRLVTGRIYPLGIAFTTNPAADVQGVIIDNGETNNKENENDEREVESIEVNSSNLLNIINKKLSQTSNIPVNNTKTKIMDLEQIIAAMKTVLAEKQEEVYFSEESVSSISAQIADKIKNKSDEIKAELINSENAKAEAIARAEKLHQDLEDNNKKLNETIAKLQELESVISTQASQEIFSSRMASLDSEYEFDDSDRQLLASEMSALDKSDEAFASFKNKVAVLYKHKNKAFKAQQDKAFQEKVESEIAKRMAKMPVQKAEASVKTTVEVETALANAKPEDALAPQQSITPTETAPSWKERLSKAFSKDNITIKF